MVNWLYTASGSWAQAARSQNGGDRLGELERDEGPQVMLWTKASPLVISNRYTINRKRAHEEPHCTKAVSIVATTGEKI